MLRLSNYSPKRNKKLKKIVCFYYFVSNIVSFGQIALLRRFVDEDKILLKLEENRKKNANTKKSGFQQKLADAMRSAEEKQKEQKNKKKQK